MPSPSNSESSTSMRANIAAAVLLLVVLFSAGWAYSQGLSGGWYYDDNANLAGLQDVDDWLGGLDFVFSGTAGPTGRPLSLLTFVPQADAWPSDPRPFLAVNIGIHLVNGLLVFLLTWLIGQALRPGDGGNRWLALGVAALWSASPFLASTSLMVIQRMALLAALFTFSGLALYVWGRLILHEKPRRGLALMVIGIGAGTVLATLAKENGILLPVLALALEATLLRRHLPPSSERLIRPALVVLLVLPTIAILAYLAWRGITAAGFAHRPFSLSERLLTQGIVLWDYVRHLLVPNQMAVTPFMDDQEIAIGLFHPPAAILALLGWAAVIIAAWLLRRQTWIPLFAVSFFLSGHLLESSIIPLELYFAHRNYVPAFGLYFGLAWFALSAFRLRPARRALAIGLVGYAALMLVILADVAATWGDPERASAYWYDQSPRSERAAQFRAMVLYDQGSAGGAALVLNAIRSRQPNNQSLLLQSLFPCVGDLNRYQSLLAEAELEMAVAERIEDHALYTLYQLAVLSTETTCPHTTPERILPLARAAWVGDRIPSDRSRERLAYAKAELARALGDQQGVLEALRLALEARPTHHTANRLAFQYVVDGQPDRATSLLRELLLDPPPHPVRAHIWKQRIGTYLEALESAD